VSDGREPAPVAYLTVPEAAGLARCHERTIRRAFEAGALPAFRPAHRVLLREDDVRAWVESQSAVETERRPERTRRSRSSAKPAPASATAPGSVAALREIQRNLRAGNTP
jgi:excisionase family DNA binding protein